MKHTFLILSDTLLIITGTALILAFIFMRRLYTKSPPDKIMIVFGKKRGHLNYKYYIGGQAFVLPIIHKVHYLDLKDFIYENRFSDKNDVGERVSFDLKFTGGISQNPAIVPNAIDHLIGLSNDRIQNLAIEIISKTVRKNLSEVIYDKNDPDKMKHDVFLSVNYELESIGLELKSFKINYL